MAKKTANLAVVSNKTFEASKVANLQHYDISSALQTTLDINELIGIFCDKIQAFIPHNSVIYINQELDIHFQKGIETRNACSYTLAIEDQSLGELKLMRQQSFHEEELQLLETLLCCLIYPLKNATLYRLAIKMAHTDPLTQTNNRAAFQDSIEREYNWAERHQTPLSLIFLDIDFFKSINDNFGHDCGDQVLHSVASRIKESIRNSDIVFRYGGEEFVILLSETSHEEAIEIAERVRSAIEQHTIAYDMQTLKITASLGVSSLQEKENSQSLVKRADDYMYKAKKNGRNKVVKD